MTQKLNWNERYCVEKFLPILTKWHLQDNIFCKKIKAKEIKKKRNPRGVPSYEVLWGDINGEYEGLIPDDQFDEDNNITKVWTTIERQDLMAEYYPDIVDEYEKSIKKSPKVKKTREKKKKENQDLKKPKRKYDKKKTSDELEALRNSLEQISLDLTNRNRSKARVSVSINKLKRKLNNNVKKKNTIESYVINKKRKCSISKVLLSPAQCAYQRKTPRSNKTEAYANAVKRYLSFFDSSELEDNDRDLSDIVDRIVTRAPVIKSATVNSNYVKLIFDNKKKIDTKSTVQSNFMQNKCSTPMSSPIRKKSMELNASKPLSKANTSYFFDKLTDDGDAFEMSLEYKLNSGKDDCDLTVDYSLPDVYI